MERRHRKIRRNTGRKVLVVVGIVTLALSFWSLFAFVFYSLKDPNTLRNLWKGVKKWHRSYR